ncbi:hypothetical protein HPB47_000475 [Ixodes persulcatus]|uniref:Uncharacterized protein n=1 Tax=Ixodes persulcatus TaxID=34615 RepID=A0AC60PRL3_IXOPE|nr:hypothetical protein HPB47_000475 [Ixodes persulcatus]
MEPKYEYASELNMYQANYMRNSKAIGVLWAVFTLCFAIINVVVFIQPHWLGDTKESRGTGHFGLWQYCHLIQDGQDVTCQGRLDDFSSIPSAAFRAATVFVGLSVVMVLLCICCMLLFFVFHSSTVFHICGWMQVFCGWLQQRTAGKAALGEQSLPDPEHFLVQGQRPKTVSPPASNRDK